MWDVGGSLFFSYSIPSPPRVLPRGQTESEPVPGSGRPRFCSRKLPSTSQLAGLGPRSNMAVDGDGQWESHGTKLARIFLDKRVRKRGTREGPMELSTASTPPLQQPWSPGAGPVCRVCIPLHLVVQVKESLLLRRVLTARPPANGRVSRCEPLTASGCSCGPMQPSRSCLMTAAAFGCHVNPPTTAC